MTEIQPANVAETKNAISYFVSIHDVYEVDEQGFLSHGGERQILGKDSNAFPVAIYQEPMPNPKEVGGYWVLNPFSTKAQPTHAQRSLFKSYKVSISNYTINLLKLIINSILVNKSIEVNNQYFDSELDATSEVRELSALTTDNKKSIASEVDAKMFEEVCALSDVKVVSEFMTSIFIMAKLQSQLNIPFLGNKDWFAEEASIKLRKKTLDVFRTMLLSIFEVESHEEFLKKYNSQAELGEPARFASNIRNVYKIHAALNKYFFELDESMVVDLSLLGEHIDNIAAYTKRAKMMTSEKIMPPKEKELKTSSLRAPQTRTKEIEERPAPRRPSSLRDVEDRERRRSPPHLARNRRSPLLDRRDSPIRSRESLPTRGSITGRSIPSHLTGRSLERNPVRDYGSSFNSVRRSAPYVVRD